MSQCLVASSEISNHLVTPFLILLSGLWSQTSSRSLAFIVFLQVFVLALSLFLRMFYQLSVGLCLIAYLLISAQTSSQRPSSPYSLFSALIEFALCTFVCFLLLTDNKLFGFISSVLYFGSPEQY